MTLYCRVFGHKAAGPLPSRCVRCDAPIGLSAREESDLVTPSESVLLEAIGAIRDLGKNDRGQTHHEACQHAPCIAQRAIDKYWEIALRPYQGVRREDSPPPGGNGHDGGGS